MNSINQLKNGNQLNDMPELKRFTCKHCKTKFVIMDTEARSILPVEIKPEKIYMTTDTYDKIQHTSHLLNCKGRQEDWEKMKKKYNNIMMRAKFEIER